MLDFPHFVGFIGTYCLKASHPVKTIMAASIYVSQSGWYCDCKFWFICLINDRTLTSLSWVEFCVTSETWKYWFSLCSLWLVPHNKFSDPCRPEQVIFQEKRVLIWDRNNYNPYLKHNIGLHFRNSCVTPFWIWPFWLVLFVGFICHQNSN